MNSEIKYTLVKLYAYLNDGYLLLSTHKDLHKKNYNCYRIPSKDTEVFIEDFENISTNSK